MSQLIDILLTGGDGQVGRALRELLPQARFLSRSDLDLGNLPVRADVDWAQHSTLVNAAAFTDVDGAELAEGRAAAWRTNVEGTRELVDIARRHRLTLVHISSDYVFDGTQAVHREDEALSPLGVYGQTNVSDELFRQILPGGVFPKETEKLSYYNLSIGYNLLPGEIFLGARRARPPRARPARSAPPRPTARRRLQRPGRGRSAATLRRGRTSYRRRSCRTSGSPGSGRQHSFGALRASFVPFGGGAGAAHDKFPTGE